MTAAGRGTDRPVTGDLRTLRLHPLIRDGVLAAAHGDLRRVQVVREEDGLILSAIVRNSPPAPRRRFAPSPPAG